MISEAGDRLQVSGAMTLGNARRLAEAGAGLLTRSENTVDLAQVNEVDSSALAVLFAWMRAAEKDGKRLLVTNPPKSLLSLADLYGVSDLLALS